MVVLLTPFSTQLQRIYYALQKVMFFPMNKLGATLTRSKRVASNSPPPVEDEDQVITVGHRTVACNRDSGSSFVVIEDVHGPKPKDKRISQPVVMQGQILDISEFVDQEQELDPDDEDDDASFHTTTSSLVHSQTSFGPSDLRPVDGDCQQAEEESHPTSLTPTPLHLKGVTRGKVVFVPETAPDTCPIHRCGGNPCPNCASEHLPVVIPDIVCHQ